MKKLFAFLNNMDARRLAHHLGVARLLLGGVAVHDDPGQVRRRLCRSHRRTAAGLRNSPWGLPMATILVFILTSLHGRAAIRADGGSASSPSAPGSAAPMPWPARWSSRLAALSTWAAGAAAKLVDRYGGNTVNRLSRFIGRNDFLAS
jgi:hypothetical protein